MSRQITQPVNQVRLTNVAVVRMNRHGKRFEVACYRNKIVNYRQGIETDLSEVLQTDRVFTNVSKGQFANTTDLQKCFHTTDEDEICKLILLKGQVQVSDMERNAQYENKTREIATMIASKCVDRQSNRPYTVQQIREGMREAEFIVHPTRSVKQQFLDCVKLMKQKGVLPIERAKMELAIIGPVNKRDLIVNELKKVGVVDFGGVKDNHHHDDDDDAMKRTKEKSSSSKYDDDHGNSSSGDGEVRVTFLIDPSMYRSIDGIVKDKELQGSCRLEIVRQVVTEEGDVTIGSEMERRSRQKAVEEGKEEIGEGHQISSSEEEEAEEEEEDGDYVMDMAKRMDQSVNVEENEEEEDHDDGVGGDTLQETLQQRNGDGEEEKEQDESGPSLTQYDVGAAALANTRKNNKKAQKKSKKAKRREKEEAAERQSRIELERQRQEERERRFGTTSSTTGADTIVAGVVDASAVGGPGGGGGQVRSCNTCGGSFETAAQYRAHFRTDWHRYNIKLKMKGIPAVSEEEFRLCDSDAFFEQDI